MGACSSTAGTTDAANTRMEQRHTKMFQQVAQMQQQQHAQKEQMMRDDPECRALMDRQMQLQQKTLAAMQSGDHGALARIQAEHMELLQNPKYMKMMMPSMSMAGMKMMGNKSNDAAGATQMLQTMMGALGGGHMNGNNGNGVSMTHEPMAYAGPSGTNPMTSAGAWGTNKAKTSYSNPYTNHTEGGYIGGDTGGGDTGNSMFSELANDF